MTDKISENTIMLNTQETVDLCRQISKGMQGYHKESTELLHEMEENFERLKAQFEERKEALRKKYQYDADSLWYTLSEIVGVDLTNEARWEMDLRYFEDHNVAFLRKGSEAPAEHNDEEAARGELLETILQGLQRLNQ